MSIEKKSDLIWMNGKMVPWEQANVHVSVHALHYGTSVFEGTRYYETAQGAAIFRLQDHTRRLFNSAKIARMPIERWTPEEINAATVDVVRQNGLLSGYLRPIAYKVTPALGLATEGQTDLAIMTWEWGAYLGEEGLTQGIDAAISSWRRPAHGTYTPMGKIGGQYVNNIYTSLEAKRNGYVEGLALDVNGLVSEGAGENLFCVMDGIIYTPPLAASVLAGITRDSVVTLARDLGMSLVEANLTREMLYICDELFMTGTAAEITPVRSLDGMPIGTGKRGEITKALQDEFFAIVKGQKEDRHGWLTPIA
ncbi:MAG: branched-chain amino acid transaminase [Anaerolineales bacterium]